MSYLESNLQMLAGRQPDLAEYLSSAGAEKVKIFVSASGLPSATYHPSTGKAIPLHSKYDPLREARGRLREYNLAGSDYVIFLGFGLGYLMDAILELEAAKTRKYFIVESDAGIFRAALEARDLKTILSLPSIHFAWPAAEADLANQWQAFFDPVHAQQSTYVMHPASLEINPAFFKGAAKVIQSQTLQTFADINTLISRAGEFLENFVRNIRRALHSPGVAQFAGKFRNTPGLLVSAGPSLDKNIHELRAYQEKLLILSTDTALKPLLQAGIEPHFILTGDPAEINYRHLEGASSEKSYLVAEVTTYPASFEDFAGRTICCSFDGSALESLCRLLADKGKLRAWGSVATMALDFALLLGCDPIILIGQDLAYSDGRTYCSGVFFIDDVFRGITDPESWQRCWENLRASAKIVTVEDVFGRPVETTDRLISYWNWIVKQLALHPQVTFINATEGGILKENVTVMSLREALHRHCGKDLAVRDRIKEEYAKGAKSPAISGGPILMQFKRESRDIHRIILRGRTICNSAAAADPNVVRQKLEAITQNIYTHANLRGLVDTFNQMGNVAFLRKMAVARLLHTRVSTAVEISKIYSDYFNSVAEALAKIDSALLRIEAELS